jgi:hypothetical protein
MSLVVAFASTLAISEIESALRDTLTVARSDFVWPSKATPLRCICKLFFVSTLLFSLRFLFLHFLFVGGVDHRLN